MKMKTNELSKEKALTNNVVSNMYNNYTGCKLD